MSDEGNLCALLSRRDRGREPGRSGPDDDEVVATVAGVLPLGAAAIAQGLSFRMVDDVRPSSADGPLDRKTNGREGNRVEGNAIPRPEAPPPQRTWAVLPVVSAAATMDGVIS